MTPSPTGTENITITAQNKWEFSLREYWPVYIWDALRDLLPFVQLKNVKIIHGGVLLLVKLQTNIF